MPAEILLADLVRVAGKLGRRNLPGDLYDDHGRFSSQTFAKRFGSWTAALQQVQLEPAHWRGISREVFLEDLCRTAMKLKSRSLRAADYRIHGKYAYKTHFRFFDCWQNAVKAAGLKPVFYRALSQSELFDNLQLMSEKLGRLPTRAEIKPPLSRFGFKAYKRRFGGLARALEVMRQNASQDVFYQRKCRRTSRTVNGRLRFLILQRDHFRCCACGQSPATNAGVQLEVGHKIPWSQGGETVAENLQTLCRRCNGGKSDS